MMSEQKVTNYSVPFIFEPPCISSNLNLFFENLKQILFLVLKFEEKIIIHRIRRLLEKISKQTNNWILIAAERNDIGL